MDDHQHTDERWLPVNGYEGIYEVSDRGRVRSLDRTITCSNGRARRLKGKVLRTPPLQQTGYPFVNLHNQGESNVRTVHSLVAEAFIGPRPEGAEVCHGDGDRTNGHLSNLRYGSSRDNSLDQVRHGTHTNAAKTQCPRGHDLFAENVPPSTAKRGRRQCLACVRARARVQYHPGLRSQLQEIADSYYQAILEERKTA